MPYRETVSPSRQVTISARRVETSTSIGATAIGCALGFVTIAPPPGGTSTHHAPTPDGNRGAATALT